MKAGSAVDLNKAAPLILRLRRKRRLWMRFWVVACAGLVFSSGIAVAGNFGFTAETADEHIERSFSDLGLPGEVRSRGCSSDERRVCSYQAPGLYLTFAADLGGANADEMTGVVDIDQMSAAVLSSGVVVAAIDPSLTADQRGEIFLSTMVRAVENIGTEYDLTVNGNKYSAKAVRGIGLVLSASAVD